MASAGCLSHRIRGKTETQGSFSAIGHFVDEARRAGASWTTIGQSIGVTKQAAQKRFVPHTPETAAPDLAVFARYSDRARSVVVHAQVRAREHAAAQIRPEHILLAVLDDDQIPQYLGEVDLDAVRASVVAAAQPGTGAVEGAIPFSPASRKALDRQRIAASIPG